MSVEQLCTDETGPKSEKVPWLHMATCSGMIPMPRLERQMH